MKADCYKNSAYERFHKKLTLSRHRTELLEARLEGISPEKSLERGYSYITDDKGHSITSKKQVTTYKAISTKSSLSGFMTVPRNVNWNMLPVIAFHSNKICI